MVMGESSQDPKPWSRCFFDETFIFGVIPSRVASQMIAFSEQINIV